MAEDQLLPTDDLRAPEDDLAAAVASTFDDDPDPGAAPPVIPFGRSWAFDWIEGRFKRSGGAPAETRGLETLKEWLEMARRTARDAHECFSPAFGMEQPEGWKGTLDVDEAASDYGVRLEEAWLVHDRVASVEDYAAHFESDEQTIVIDDLTVRTDNEGAVTMPGRAPLIAE
jgi:hypothetical protein